MTNLWLPPGSHIVGLTAKAECASRSRQQIEHFSHINRCRDALLLSETNKSLKYFLQILLHHPMADKTQKACRKQSLEFFAPHTPISDNAIAAAASHYARLVLGR